MNSTRDRVLSFREKKSCCCGQAAAAAAGYLHIVTGDPIEFQRQPSIYLYSQRGVIGCRVAGRRRVVELYQELVFRLCCKSLAI